MTEPARPDVLICGAARTPIGSFNGALSSLPAPELGSLAISAALERAGVEPAHVEGVRLGNVVQAGLGQNPARQSTLLAGLPRSTGAITINRVCGSGLQAVTDAAAEIRLGEASLLVAGGMESMSRAPHLLDRARTGYRLGDGRLVDSLLRDGLSNATDGTSMGIFGDRTATALGLSREEQDDYAVRSYTLSRRAHEQGLAARSIVPVQLEQRGKTVTIDEDEEFRRFDEVKLRGLSPAFTPDGTVTAGNASTISDGAAAVVLASRERAAELGLRSRARILGSASFSREPGEFTIAPAPACQRLLDRLGWTVDDVDVFEINEAFAVVVLAAQRELAIPLEKINVLGGAISLGHPIGASGARTLVTLLDALEHRGGTRGLVTLCVGGGEAVAMAVERVDD